MFRWLSGYDEDIAYEGMSLNNHAFSEDASVLGGSVTADGYHNVTVFTHEPDDVALNLETVRLKMAVPSFSMKS